ncbi:hypothetical protein [uncultured Sphingomonas sp.]|uniref:hypothetical protein n=1 Tax=uncultured Sphingomonas sp. TaxID=158754 RepID=UPI0025982B32|nr:hypothetical protein [uncultured Sphingomonas sp.]
MTRIARLMLTGGLISGVFAAVGLMAGQGSAQRGGKAPELAYQLTEGQNLNAFVRDGAVAAHLLLRNGTDPRILVAFPAGNSGVGLWFEPLAAPATWTLDQAPRPQTLRDAKGRPLYGIQTTASIAAPRLAFKQAVLTNVRFLRDYQAIGRFPAEVAVGAPQVSGSTIVWQRDRLDGAAGYRLEITVLEGQATADGIAADANGRIRLRIVAASGEAPLHGIPLDELLNANAANDPGARNALRFLSYREKFNAGSWRFNTYFGRDTLMSLRLLMPALRGPAIEAGLGSVLARLGSPGDVAHEEGIGEFAVVEHRKDGSGGDGATLDYGMVDDDYMLAPVAMPYLLGDRAAARRFLARSIPSAARPGSSETAGAGLVRNLRFVVEQARRFADVPTAANLVAIHDGRLTGEWRDSEEGLGRGKYAYDVNAVLVPAALDAGAKLLSSGLLDPYVKPVDRASLMRAGAMAVTWRAKAPDLFRVSLPAAQAAPMIRDYAQSLGVPADPAITALGSRPLVYHALSLDAKGRPVPIINSDEGFALLFGDPDPDDLDTYVAALARPFPAGLMTDVGLLVANPALAPREVQARFTPAAYHGAVVWSWQQALFAAGLARQLARTDLPPSTRRTLTEAQGALWRAIQATRATQSSELWSWAFDGGKYRVVPFGAGKQDVDESNAAQLWSTVYLAVQPPGSPATSAPRARRR